MLKFSGWSYLISDTSRDWGSKRFAVACADSALNEFTLENVTAALSAPFTGVKALAELRALSYFAWEGYPKHYDLGEEITRH